MIPLSSPNISGNEWRYVKECLDTEWVSSSGKFVDKFEDSLKNFSGSKHAIACMNGTSALQLSIRLLGVVPDDEVLIPTLTFIAPVNAIWYNNAYPVFMDVDRYYNLDVDKTIDFLNRETYRKGNFTYNKITNRRISAIIPVHMYGNAVDIKPILDICKNMNIVVIEDASESLGTIYKDSYISGKHTGCVGDIGCISFNGNKIITSGGGGMILTDKKSIAEKAKYLSTQAKDDPVRYIHNDIGYNFRITNIQAAVGLAQMEQLNTFLDIKRDTYNYYKNAIYDIDGLTVSEVPAYSRNNHWMVLIKINKKIYKCDREGLMNLLSSHGIQTRPAWSPIHLQKPYSSYQNYKITMANKLVDESLCIPASTNISKENLNKVISILK